MSFKPLSALRRGIGATWRAIDATRRAVLNLIFLIILIIVLVAMFGGGAKPIAAKTALVLELRGDLVEQHAGSVRDALMANVSGEQRRSVQLRDLITVLDAAGKDANISSVVL